jgi:hypothetical protein
LREARKENKRVVHDIMLQSVEPVFDEHARHFTFDLAFGAEGGSEKINVSVPTNLKLADCEGEVSKAATQNTMTPVDATRFGFALREAVALRSWATTIAPAVFQNGLYGFLQKAPINAQIMEDESLETTMGQIAAGLSKLQSHEMESDQVVYYAYSSVRASLMGMDQLLTLEKKYSALVNKGKSSGVLTTVTPRVSLAGDVLPDAPVGDPASSSAGPAGDASARSGGADPNNEMAVPGSARFDAPPGQEDPLEESERAKQRIQEPPKDGPELQDPGYCPCSGKGRKAPDERGRPGDSACVGGKCVVQ